MIYNALGWYLLIKKNHLIEWTTLTCLIYWRLWVL